ncbi:MAG: deoxyhypusine synthase family protein, partial [Candidatus Aenigmatarchaeota archaeon]
MKRKTIKHLEIRSGMSIDELVKQMRLSAFGARKLATAADICEEMIKDKECKIFLGVAGAMVPAGMKNIIFDMLDKGWVDIFVTTGANLTHDLAEALGYPHYTGFSMSDKKLHDLGMSRIYDSYMPTKAYLGLEKFFQSALEKIPKNEMGIREFLFELGRIAPKDSLLHICHKKNIPLFCPAIADSGIGLQIWSYIAGGKYLAVNTFSDLKEIISIAWSAKRKGVIYIGGGVPKNYIQQSMQVSKPADYGVQITTDRPE